MSKHSELAKQNFLNGYNCTQAVVLAFADELDVDRDTLLKIASPFGGGMGRLREVCGAVSAMFMVLGLKEGYTDPKDTAAKAALYKKVQELAARSQKENGSIVCRELLKLSQKKDSPVPEERTPEYYKKRPCPDLVALAAQILDEYLETK